MVVWLFACLLVCLFVSLLVCWSAGLLVCWSAGLLVCWSAGRREGFGVIIIPWYVPRFIGGLRFSF
jgi:hypothetical protein